MSTEQNELIRQIKSKCNDLRLRFDPEKLVEMYRLIAQLRTEEPEPTPVYSTDSPFHRAG